MQVEEIFIWGKNERKTGELLIVPSSVANQNAGFALVHLLGDTKLRYYLKHNYKSHTNTIAWLITLTSLHYSLTLGAYTPANVNYEFTSHYSQTARSN